MEFLFNIGFVHSATTSITNNQLSFDIYANANATKVLYAFVQNQTDVRYIGYTRNSLRTRLNGYSNPGQTQRTNINVNAMARQLLEQGNNLDLYVFTNHGLLQYGGLNLDVAAGLEKPLIEYVANYNNQNNLEPLWNIDGNQHYNPRPNIQNIERNNLEADEEIAENIQYPPNAEVIIHEFDNPIELSITLGETYFNKGFINIPLAYSQFLGLHGTQINIVFQNLPQNQEIIRTINRNANNNGAPRIYIGNQLTDWLHNHFQIGDELTIEILGPGTIRILLP